MSIYHRTREDRLDSIKNDGLKINQKTHLTEAGEWSFDVYGCKPIFLGLEKASVQAYAGESPVLLVIAQEHEDELELVADLPSLADLGAYYDLDSDVIYWKNTDDTPELLKPFLDDNGYLPLSEFLLSYSPLTETAIKITKTAAVLMNIPARYVKVEL